MKLFNIIDNALLNSGGLNTNVPQVRDNIINFITDSLCENDEFKNLLDDGDCDRKDPYMDSPVFAALAENQPGAVKETKQANLIKQPEPSPIQPKIGDGKKVKSGVKVTKKQENTVKGNKRNINRRTKIKGKK